MTEQRHQGARRELRAVQAPVGVSRPDHQTRASTWRGDHLNGVAERLDTSDLDRYMGVPMEPGELKEPVAVNDIRRWVQAMHYPNPLHYDEDWAAARPLRPDRGAPVLPVACDTSHGCSPAQVGPHPQLASHLRRRRVVVLRAAGRRRRPPGVPPHALRLPGRRTPSSPGRPASSGATPCTSTSEASGRPAALDRHPLPGAGGQGEAPVRRGRRPGMDRRAAAGAGGHQGRLHRPDPGPAPRPAAVGVGRGGPGLATTCWARTAWPASPPSGGPTR